MPFFAPGPAKAASLKLRPRQWAPLFKFLLDGGNATAGGRDTTGAALNDGKLTAEDLERWLGHLAPVPRVLAGTLSDAPFHTKMPSFLPRQARDKQKENSKSTTDRFRDRRSTLRPEALHRRGVSPRGRRWKRWEKRKLTFLAMPLCTQNDHFAKTGSGQILGNESTQKERRFSAGWVDEEEFSEALSMLREGRGTQAEADALWDHIARRKSRVGFEQFCVSVPLEQTTGAYHWSSSARAWLFACCCWLAAAPFCTAPGRTHANT